MKDKFLDEAIIRNSKLFFELSVLAYVFSKIFSKPRYLEDQHRNEFLAIERLLNQLQSGVGRKGDADMLEIVKQIEQLIKKIEEEDRRFFHGLMAKGRLKMAATMYAKGVSLGTASEMSDADQQAIQDYAGSTMMFDRLKEEIDIKDRVAKARKLIVEEK